MQCSFSCGSWSIHDSGDQMVSVIHFIYGFEVSFFCRVKYHEQYCLSILGMIIWFNSIIPVHVAIIVCAAEVQEVHFAVSIARIKALYLINIQKVAFLLDFLLIKDNEMELNNTGLQKRPCLFMIMHLPVILRATVILTWKCMWAIGEVKFAREILKGTWPWRGECKIALKISSSTLNRKARNKMETSAKARGDYSITAKCR